MSLSRQEFLKGALASLVFLALPGGLWVAPAGWKPKKKPNLVFGVVSDTHMRCHYDGKSFYSHNGACFGDHALVAVMKHFKAEGVDAILHCGDVTDRGMVREMEFYKEAWDKVYGGSPRPANLIVTGNHDVERALSFWAKGVAHSEDPAVYDDMMTIGRIWVSVKPKPVVGSLGPDWVMPLSGFTPNSHPLKAENYVKVIGSTKPRKAGA